MVPEASTSIPRNNPPTISPQLWTPLQPGQGTYLYDARHWHFAFHHNFWFGYLLTRGLNNDRVSEPLMILKKSIEHECPFVISPEGLCAARYGPIDKCSIFADATDHTIENNPEVMNSLVQELGLSPSLQFHDVWSLYEPSLLEFLPRPAYAMLLVFPVNETYQKFRREEDATKEEYDKSGTEEPVLWFKQTIRNACGLMGVLHSVTNGEARNHIVPGSTLDQLYKAAIPLDRKGRVELLENSRGLESAHSHAAFQGDTAAPPAEDDIEHHYVAFVKDAMGDLWELDGSRKGPLNRGRLGPDEDVLSEKGQELGVRAFLKREEAAGGGDLRFSVVMLGPSLD